MTRNRMPMSIAAAAGAAALLALAGCSASGPSEPFAAGSWGAPDEEGGTAIEFSAPSNGKGTFSGTDGCNVVNGGYEVREDGSVALGEMASTMMFCEGVDTWLTSKKGLVGTVDGPVMKFVDEDGNEAGSLAERVSG